MKKLITFVFVVVVIYFVVTSVVTIIGEAAIERNKRELTRKIESSSLYGKPPEKVIEFLDAERIQHGKYYRKHPYHPYLDRTVSAVRRDVAYTWRWNEDLRRWNISMIFDFDDNDKFERYFIGEERTI